MSDVPRSTGPGPGGADGVKSSGDKLELYDTHDSEEVWTTRQSGRLGITRQLGHTV